MPVPRTRSTRYRPPSIRSKCPLMLRTQVWAPTRPAHAGRCQTRRAQASSCGRPPGWRRQGVLSRRVRSRSQRGRPPALQNAGLKPCGRQVPVQCLSARVWRRADTTHRRVRRSNAPRRSAARRSATRFNAGLGRAVRSYGMMDYPPHPYGGYGGYPDGYSGAAAVCALMAALIQLRRSCARRERSRLAWQATADTAAAAAMVWHASQCTHT